jgi:hypothetical protein
MTNSSGAQDHSFGAIEAAVRETARGRAFLTDYAKRVRQSDTLTMLAIIGRLERWCQEQSLRLAELEGRDSALGGQEPGSQSDVALDHPTATTEQMIGGGEALLLHANHLDVLAVTVGDQNPASGDRTSFDMDGDTTNGKARHRIQHLASTFCDLDRRTACLVDRSHATVEETGPLSMISSTDDGARVLISHSGTSDAWVRSSRNTKDKSPLEEDVLEGIAQALGIRRTSNDR